MGVRDQVRFWIDAKRMSAGAVSILAEGAIRHIGRIGNNFEEPIRPIWQGATGLYSKSFWGNRQIGSSE
jgi:hypothetical protein